MSSEIPSRRVSEKKKNVSFLVDQLPRGDFPCWPVPAIRFPVVFGSRTNNAVHSRGGQFPRERFTRQPDPVQIIPSNYYQVWWLIPAGKVPNIKKRSRGLPRYFRHGQFSGVKAVSFRGQDVLFEHCTRPHETKRARPRTPPEGVQSGERKESRPGRSAPRSKHPGKNPKNRGNDGRTCNRMLAPCACEYPADIYDSDKRGRH